jgi:transposase
MRQKAHEGSCKTNSEISTEKKIDRRQIELINATKKVIESWEALKQEGVDVATIPKTLGISRATYYRRRKMYAGMMRGVWPPSKRPKHPRSVCWTAVQVELIRQIRRENPTYEKEKIAIILKRDHEQKISQSTVGRILKCLMYS